MSQKEAEIPVRQYVRGDGPGGFVEKIVWIPISQIASGKSLPQEDSMEGIQPTSSSASTRFSDEDYQNLQRQLLTLQRENEDLKLRLDQAEALSRQKAQLEQDLKRERDARRRLERELSTADRGAMVLARVESMSQQHLQLSQSQSFAHPVTRAPTNTNTAPPQQQPTTVTAATVAPPTVRAAVKSPSAPKTLIPCEFECGKSFKTKKEAKLHLVEEHGDLIEGAAPENFGDDSGHSAIEIEEADVSDQEYEIVTAAAVSRTKTMPYKTIETPTPTPPPLLRPSTRSTVNAAPPPPPPPQPVPTKVSPAPQTSGPVTATTPTPPGKKKIGFNIPTRERMFMICEPDENYGNIITRLSKEAQIERERILIFYMGKRVTDTMTIVSVNDGQVFMVALPPKQS